MSQSFDAFCDLVLEDEALQAELNKSTNRDALIAATVKLGAEHGFVFDDASVAARLESSNESSGSPELSDAELAGVAGGYVSFGESILCGFCGPTSGTSGSGSKATKKTTKPKTT